MPWITPPRGPAGATFNGGTITDELDVSPSVSASGTLILHNPDHEATGSLVLKGTNADADDLFRFYSDGSVELQNETGSPVAPGGAFVVTDLGPVAATDFIIAGARGGARGGVGAGGYLKMRAVNAAPADATLLAGDLALWFDSTNGAAKLMVKGKSANGSVVTGSLALT